jgi:tetratricopeptide (TPR) repeat protein
MQLTDAFLSKTIKIVSAITISIVLFLLNASYPFNVYAQQQGGAATGGAATGGAATGGAATATGVTGLTCNQCTIINAPQATGGAAASGAVTGGAASGPEGTGRATATDVSTLVDKGNALFRQGNYAEAITSYDKALAVDPNYKGALYSKGLALKKQGNYAEAITYYDKALAVDPNYKLALDNKRIAISKMGQ